MATFKEQNKENMQILTPADARKFAITIYFAGFLSILYAVSMGLDISIFYFQMLTIVITSL